MNPFGKYRCVVFNTQNEKDAGGPKSGFDTKEEAVNHALEMVKDTLSMFPDKGLKLGYYITCEGIEVDRVIL